jgi:hypothetical protein
MKSKYRWEITIFWLVTDTLNPTSGHHELECLELSKQLRPQFLTILFLKPELWYNMLIHDQQSSSQVLLAQHPGESNEQPLSPQLHSVLHVLVGDRGRVGWVDSVGVVCVGLSAEHKMSGSISASASKSGLSSETGKHLVGWPLRKAVYSRVL